MLMLHLAFPLDSFFSLLRARPANESLGCVYEYVRAFPITDRGERADGMRYECQECGFDRFHRTNVHATLCVCTDI